jgi:hypothetical protein
VDAPPAGLAAPHDADPETGRGEGFHRRRVEGFACTLVMSVTIVAVALSITWRSSSWWQLIFLFFFAFLFWWEEDVDPGAVAACSVLTRCSMICRLSNRNARARVLHLTRDHGVALQSLTTVAFKFRPTMMLESRGISYCRSF